MAAKSAYQQEIISRDAYIGVSTMMVLFCTLLRVLWQLSAWGRAGAPFPPDRYY
jgi:uncharacterized membrane protein